MPSPQMPEPNRRASLWLIAAAILWFLPWPNITTLADPDYLELWECLAKLFWLSSLVCCVGGMVCRKGIIAKEGSRAKVPGEFLFGFVAAFAALSILLLYCYEYTEYV